MRKLVIMHGQPVEEKSRSNSNTSILTSRGINETYRLGSAVRATHEVDTKVAAISDTPWSKQTANVLSGLKPDQLSVVRFAVYSTLDEPVGFTNLEIMHMLRGGNIPPEARQASDLILANPPNEHIWIVGRLIMAGLSGARRPDLPPWSKFSELREMEI